MTHPTRSRLAQIQKLSLIRKLERWLTTIVLALPVIYLIWSATRTN